RAARAGVATRGSLVRGSAGRALVASNTGDDGKNSARSRPHRRVLAPALKLTSAATRHPRSHVRHGSKLHAPPRGRESRRPFCRRLSSHGGTSTERLGGLPCKAPR